MKRQTEVIDRLDQLEDAEALAVALYMFGLEIQAK